MHDLITEDGRYIREKFPASHSEKQAHDRWAEINVVFNTIVNAARRCLATPEGQRQVSVALDRAIEQGIAHFHGVTEPAALAVIDKLHKQESMVRLARELGAQVPYFLELHGPVDADAREVITTEAGIKAWIAGRKTVPSNETIRKRKSKFKLLLAYLGLPDDLTWITGTGLEKYKKHLLAEYGNNKANDHLTDINAVLRAALPKRDNPADDITVPPKRDGRERPAFSEAEAAILLRAADHHANPVVEWGTRLGEAGMIHTEWADANVADLLIDSASGAAYLWVRIDNREGDAKHLKTRARGRQVPIPSRWADRFLAYVECVRAAHGPDAPLFPGITPDRDGRRNTRASTLILDFIRQAGIDNVTDPDTGEIIVRKDSYSWRKRFVSRLESIPFVRHPVTGVEIANKMSRQRYLSGHAGQGTNERAYAEHPVAETIHIVNAIPDPIAPKPERE